MKIHCDLNIPCSGHLDRTAIDKLKLILSQLTQLNECAVALNYKMEGFNKNNIPRLLDTNIINPASFNSNYSLKIYTRITIDTNEPIHNEDLMMLRQKFDLIALRTNNLKVFQDACHIYNIDIISLHCDERLAFELKSIDIKQALKRKIYFELCYAPAIRDNQSRSFTIQLAKQLYEYTLGDNMIISSEAEIVSEIRSPGSIFYFAKSIGLPNDKAKFTTEKHCQQLLNKIKQ
ncbi:RNase P subunit p30-domain-containing protein [Cokeromyces recurvatus]|uniref:RNase P subunit p30-domain-containing protein n=1 Tax=Cokeromyces recurvatus TaxID=90255 RepID=UPI002221158C|nr:RNase P subunit p30-domain-containing protein [Cokeromyces recurvatus]KAI7903133.1 RNase P subunit p30-domain-containing protein [Cokeromyces recurvatus]